jgi:pantoate--beta-alanine ligase
MKAVKSVAEMKNLSHGARASGRKIVFVPTMGTLHEGHIALFREGKKRGGPLVVSIFVNPTQFNNKEDFEKYPRDLESDLKKCEREGVDVVFAPSVEEIYPTEEKETVIPLPAVAKPLEGVSRPGHFQGVVQVVAKLFQIVRPQVAIFGQKDYQQLRVIQEMVKQQNFDVEIVSYPTVRTPEGLAMSSRNARLSRQGLKSALALPRSLKLAETLFLRGERDASRIQKSVEQELSRETSVRIDYAAVVDAETLQEMKTIRKRALVAIAAFVEGVRLIDNCLLDPDRVEGREK